MFAVTEKLPLSSGISLFLDGDLGGKFMPGFGVDQVALTLAPIGERTRIDVDAFDGLSGGLKFLLRTLRRSYEMFPGLGEVVGVFEDGDEGVVIFLPAPRKANRN